MLQDRLDRAKRGMAELDMPLHIKMKFKRRAKDQLEVALGLYDAIERKKAKGRSSQIGSGKRYCRNKERAHERRPRRHSWSVRWPPLMQGRV